MYCKKGNDGLGLGRKVVRQQLQFWAGRKVEKMRVEKTVCNEKETGEWPNLHSKKENTGLVRRNRAKAVTSALFTQFCMILVWIISDHKAYTNTKNNNLSSKYF